MNPDLIALIKADPTVSDLIGGTRIYWQHAPQAPAADAVYAVLTKTSGVIGVRHDGLSLLNDARIQIDCFGPTLAQAQSLREAITSAIGGIQATTQGATRFQAIIPQSPRDYPAVNGIHRCLSDFLVTYRPA